MKGSLGYVGDIKSNFREGHGVYTYPNTFFKYEGEWHNSVKNGFGSLIMKDGSYYRGQFTNGEIDGCGLRFWADTGNTYEGEFEKGEMCGRGFMRYGDGGMYEGSWLDNRRHGEGVLTEPDGSVYTGSLYLHRRHGEGEQIYSNIGMYQGGWIKNLRQGHGKMVWDNGSTYYGQWRADDMHGEGRLTHFSQIICDSMWNNGRPLDEASSICAVNGMEIVLDEGEVQPFNIEIDIKSIDDEVSSSESGRHLQLTAGIRVIEKAVTPSKQSLNSAGANETPRVVTTHHSNRNDKSPNRTTHSVIVPPPLGRRITPFGFDVDPYPVSIKAPSAESSEMSSNEITIPLTESLRTQSAEPALANSVQPPASPMSFKDGFKHVNSESRRDSLGGSEIAPPILITVRTTNGKATFSNIFLPPVNPTTASQPFSTVSPDNNTEVKPTGSRRGKQDSTSSGKIKKNLKVKPENQEKVEESIVPDSQCKPGDYVIIIEDITESPFLDITLEPLYVLVKVPQPLMKKKSRSDKRFSKVE